VAEDVKVLESIQPSDGAYRPDSWTEWTPEELRWWVLLLRKRAEHRVDPAWRDKDLHQASIYEAMLKAVEKEKTETSVPRQETDAEMLSRQLADLRAMDTSAMSATEKSRHVHAKTDLATCLRLMTQEKREQRGSVWSAREEKKPTKTGE
jgi:hypothetical protein